MAWGYQDSPLEPSLGVSTGHSHDQMATWRHLVGLQPVKWRSRVMCNASRVAGMWWTALDGFDTWNGRCLASRESAWDGMHLGLDIVGLTATCSMGFHYQPFLIEGVAYHLGNSVSVTTPFHVITQVCWRWSGRILKCQGVLVPLLSFCTLF